MLIYQIALTLIPGIGDVLGKKLVVKCGSAEAVFKEPKRFLQRIEGIGEVLSRAVGKKEALIRAEKEVEFITRFHILPLFFQDTDYPWRLKHCIDSPVMLFYKGSQALNADKILGIVGTRSATGYGKETCRELVSGIKSYTPLIVSGLAYGIDSCAHRSALDSGLNTIGVLGHGLDRIYPYANHSLAERMLNQGGLVTEFLSGTKPDRENFPKRNRIIAGLCDALVVVEAARKGGALITADIANSYNRDVFAIPGRIGDPYSEGANYLIRTNQAHLFQSAENIAYIMGWKQREVAPVVQRKIFIELTADEELIIQFLRESATSGIDEISAGTGLTMSHVSAGLLNLEFEELVQALPGKVYRLK